jgi:ABC-2 type transport system ATP-binding protein
VTNDTIISTENVGKSFGKVEALKGVDLEVAAGTVFGLLGPNGAGKTTMIRILTTLLGLDSGTAHVAGFDVVRDARELRASIGLAGQYAAVDENLTGHENLEMVGRLYHLPGREARRRASTVLERFGLSDAANRTTKTYSGGMRRRLDVAASLVGRPKVLFLDEPTTGLDPASRLDLWGLIRELVNDGTSLMLTTQYLEEADSLTDRIAVIDHGSVIAEGTSNELKDQIGGEVVQIRVADRNRTKEAAVALEGIGGELRIDEEAGQVTVPVGFDGATSLVESVRQLDSVDLQLSDIALHRPTLDDVFLSLTGHAAQEEQEDEGTPGDGAGRRRRGKEGA